VETVKIKPTQNKKPILFTHIQKNIRKNKNIYDEIQEFVRYEFDKKKIYIL